MWKRKEIQILLRKIRKMQKSGEQRNYPLFFVYALRRTFRLRAMGALSQVKVVCSASCYQLASESLVKIIASEPCSDPPMLLGD